eukprot:TRINITY_DN18382_c0_g1_i1.p1 TRINITY_DN18382_c0_g1~~TRINITY_DN18382_c0_g1_i1.p1  ORF type:complete len:352 (+),score=139.63 TRINITY_DN18382_c0_g1_i1:75-1058(+)
MGDSKPKHMTVLGACFMDYVSFVDRFPSGGETLHANSFQKGFGGKGANMAVIIGKLGGRCRMVGAVGADGDGADYIQNFKREGIETDCVVQREGQTTGLANIVVDSHGENTIVICPNATGTISPEWVASTSWLEGTDMVICQNEVPLATNLWALRKASEAGKMTVYVPAPAPTPEQLPELHPVMKFVSIFAPNQHEASLMLGYEVKGIEEGKRAALDLRNRVMNEDSQVIITMGSQGAIVLEKFAKEAVHVPGTAVPKADVVDTTGAGDCFAGSMCYFLSVGHGLMESVKRANFCAGLSVQKKGTQSSYPSASDLPANITSSWRAGL